MKAKDARKLTEEKNNFSDISLIINSISYWAERGRNHVTQTDLTIGQINALKELGYNVSGETVSW